MSIIDSHVHVWPNGGSHLGAAGAVDPPLADAQPDALLGVMQPEGVASAVLVQYIGHRWDNTYVARMLLAYPGRFMGVCRVDPEDPAAPERLRYWTTEHGFRGVRISPEADARGDWFCRTRARALFQQAAELDVPVVVLTKPSRLPDLLEILDAVPDVNVVIDHFADCSLDNSLHRSYLHALAQHPTTFLKTGHVWSNSSLGYPWRDQHALVKQACEWFGAGRIMWGSDWPFCLRRAAYAQALSYLRDEMTFLSQEDRAWILGGTARRLWPFAQPAEQSGTAATQGKDGDDFAT